MRKFFILSMGLAFLAAPFSFAQSTIELTDIDQRSLADIKLEISFLTGQIDNLRQELVQTGAPLSTTNQGDPIERVQAIEAELRSLIGRIELLEFKIRTVVAEQEQRLLEIDRKLTALEGGEVDEQSLGQTRNGPSLTVAEAADYEQALAALKDEDFERAATLLAAYANTHPSSPILAEVHYLRGTSYEAIGDQKEAGRGYLDSFTQSADGAFASKALMGLGRSLAALEKNVQACRSFAEVIARFQGSDEAKTAQAQMDALACQ